MGQHNGYYVTSCGLKKPMLKNIGNNIMVIMLFIKPNKHVSLLFKYEVL